MAGILLGVAAVGAVVLSLYRIGEPIAPEKSDSYYRHAWKNKIVFSPMGNWFELGYVETTADPTTFEVLTREYGRDKDFIYWQGHQQPADRNTFTVDADWIAKDAAHVYYDPKKFDGHLAVLPGADPATFQRYRVAGMDRSQIWCMDKNHFYLNHQQVAVDRATFRVLNGTLACDSAALYTVLLTAAGDYEFQSHPRPPGEIRVLNSVYLQAGSHLVHASWKEKFALAAFDAVDTLRWINELTVVVNERQLLYAGRLVPGIDIASASVIEPDFLKDKHHVFFKHQQITGADPATFEIIFSDYSRDAHHAFFQHQKLEGVDVRAFTYQFNTGLATDGTRYFKDGKPVQSPAQN